MKLSRKQKKQIKKYGKELEKSDIAKKVAAEVKDIDGYLDKLGNGKSKIQIFKHNGPIKFESFKDIKKFWIKHLDFFAIIAIMVFVVYANGLNGAFVSDDIEGYVNNPLIKDFWGALKTLNLHYIHLAFVYALFQANPIPLHIDSVILHILNVFLAFTFIRTMFGKKEAMLMSILFALHPVNVESVTWISGSGYPIRALFIMLLLVIYQIFIETKNKKYYWAAFTIFFLQMFTMPSPQNLVVLPMIVVFEYFIKRLPFKLKDLTKYIPYAILYIWYIYEYQTSFGSRIVETNPTAIDKNPYLQRLGYSIYKSIILLFTPVKLSLYHDAEVITPAMLTVMYICVALLALYIAKNIFKKRDRYFGWVLLALASVLYMISPIQVAWFIAERYLYIVSIIFSIIVVMLLSKIERDYKFKNLTLIVVIIISLIFSTRVIARNMDWKTRKSLWESTIAIYPNSARAYNNLGDVYAKEENYEKSVKSFEKAIELQPNYADAIHNLGITYLHMDEYDKATEQFEKAYSINPSMYQALFHLAATKFEQEKYEEALQYTEQLLQMKPDYEPAIQGKMLLQQKILEKSLQQ